MESALPPEHRAPPAPDPRFTPGCRFHGRGVDNFDAKLASAGLPSILTLIDERLRKRGRCRILETGCGEGRLLLELLETFGKRVELHGSNYEKDPVLVGSEPLLRTNEHYRVMSATRLRILPQPTLYLADLQDMRGVPAGGFDFILSQTMMHHVPNKARALEESARLLAPEGTFLHELDSIDLPPAEFLDTDMPRFTIFKGEERISSSAYLRGRGIDVRSCERHGVQGYFGVYQKAAGPLRLDLELDPKATGSLHLVVAATAPFRVWGTRSVYHLAD